MCELFKIFTYHSQSPCLLAYIPWLLFTRSSRSIAQARRSFEALLNSVLEKLLAENKVVRYGISRVQRLCYKLICVQPKERNVMKELTGEGNRIQISIGIQVEGVMCVLRDIGRRLYDVAPSSLRQSLLCRITCWPALHSPAGRHCLFNVFGFCVSVRLPFSRFAIKLPAASAVWHLLGPCLVQFLTTERQKGQDTSSYQCFADPFVFSVRLDSF